MSDSFIESGDDGRAELSEPTAAAPSSFLKKAGLFGQSVAISPKSNDVSMIAEKNEKNGGDSTSDNNEIEEENSDSLGAVIEAEDDSMESSGDHSETNGSAAIDREVADDGNEVGEQDAETLNQEPEIAEASKNDETMQSENTEEPEIDEADINDEEVEPVNTDDVDVSKASETEEEKQEDPEKEVEGQDQGVDEDVCVKKVVSMDTSDTEKIDEMNSGGENEQEHLPNDVDLAVDEEDVNEDEEKPEMEELGNDVETEATPKRDRNGIGSTLTPASGEDAEWSTPVTRGKSPRVAAQKSTTASPRGRRSIKTDVASTPRGKRGHEHEEKTDEVEDDEEKSPKRGRRSTRSVPSPAKSPREPVALEKEEEEEDVDKEVVEDEEKPRGRGRKSAASTPKGPKTPARNARSAKKEDTGEAVVERRTLRERGVKTPAQTSPEKSGSSTRSRRSSVKTNESIGDKEEDEEHVEEEEKKTPTRGRSRKSVIKTPPSSAKKGKDAEGEDPFDMETEFDKHPEPLKNITVEKGSFGEMKYTRTPGDATSKYSNTEQSASARVASLANTPVAGTPKTIASVQSNRKSLGGSTPTIKRSVTAPASSGRRKKTEENEDEHMEFDDGGEEEMDTSKTRGTPGRKRKADTTPSFSAKKAPTIDIPQLDADSQWAADHPEDDQAPLVPGARVYAAFNKVFYPALVGERDGLGRYHVRFVEDDVVRPVPIAGVVPLAAVTCQKECLITDDTGDLTACTVTKSPNAANAKDWQESMFTLNEMEGTREFTLHWSKLSLEMASTEWKKYVHDRSAQATKVTTDNIASLSDRRERRSRVSAEVSHQANVEERTPRSSASTKKSRISTLVSPALDKSTPIAKGRGRGRVSMKALQSVEKEEEPPKLEEKESLSEEAPPTLPTEDGRSSRIFLGKTFILTSANRAGADGVAFKKNEMKKAIQERGGIVVDDIAGVPLDADAYLISDTHYRTHKYLAALARAMPCVSHRWAVECVSRETLLDHTPYLLYGGQGILDGLLYPLPSERGVLLKGKGVAVHSKNDTTQKKGAMSFKQIWDPIVELLGANVVDEKELDADDPPAMDILLTDSSASPALVAAVQKKGAAVVSSEWLIQAIIMNKCPAFDAHARFKYDSGNEPTKTGGGSTN